MVAAKSADDKADEADVVVEADRPDELNGADKAEVVDDEADAV